MVQKLDADLAAKAPSDAQQPIWIVLESMHGSAPSLSFIAGTGVEVKNNRLPEAGTSYSDALAHAERFTNVNEGPGGAAIVLRISDAYE